MRYILILLLLLPFGGYSQFTYYGNVILLSQESLDNFGAWDYEKIDGNLTIGYWNSQDSSDITDLSALLPLKFVTKSCIIKRNPKLKNLSGLDSLKTIGYGLRISTNRQLLSLSSLGNINTSLNTKSLDLYNNPNLTSLDGLYLNADSLNTIDLSYNKKLLNISALNHIKKLKGGLYISRTDLTNLDDLKQLEQIRGLEIQHCPNLKKIDFPNIKLPMSWVEIRDNKALTTISGMQNAINKPESFLSLEIEDNPELTTIESFNKIKRFSLISIDKCPKLNSINGLLDNAEAVTELYIKNTNIKSFGPFAKPFPKTTYNIKIIDNDSLNSVEGLMGLERVNGKLSILGNYLLQTLKGLDSLSYTVKNPGFGSNGLRHLHNLSNLDTVATKGLGIYDNPRIKNLEGLEKFSYAKTGIVIDLDSLEDLSALTNHSVTTESFFLYNMHGVKEISLDSFHGINNYLIIADNSSLKKIIGFGDIDTLHYLEISGNPNLNTIEDTENLALVENGLKLYSNPAISNISGLCPLFINGKIKGNITIKNNAQGFNSIQEIKDWCLTPTNDLPTYDAINIYPNPASAEFFIDVPLELVQVGMMVDLLDISGISHFSARLKGSVSWIPVVDMAPGLYFLRIVYDGRLVEVRKIVVEW